MSTATDNAPLGAPIRQAQAARPETPWRPAGVKGYVTRINADGHVEVARDEDVRMPAQPAAQGAQP